MIEPLVSVETVLPPVLGAVCRLAIVAEVCLLLFATLMAWHHSRVVPPIVRVVLICQAGFILAVMAGIVTNAATASPPTPGTLLLAAGGLGAASWIGRALVRELARDDDHDDAG